EVDHRADIFAVGILAYELLTGRRLFLGDTDYKTVEMVRVAETHRSAGARFCAVQHHIHPDPLADDG
ncbi:MAG: hypothetical protein ACE1Z0_03075, partial [Acidimicrobiia bacterium]